MSMNKILVPIDGSESSGHALELALGLAEAFGAEVTVLEVIEEFGPLPGYYEAAPAGASNRVDWIAQQRFEKIYPILADSKTKWERKVLEGYAADKVCEVAEKEKFDHIVIGSRGLNPLGRFLLGSVSDRVVHHAHCSVTVVK